MELVRGLHNLGPVHRGCVATIGNFDGVHCGHRAVLAHLRERAGELGLPAVLVTFEPQPREYFDPEGAPARLTLLREKILLLSGTGIDRVLLLHFDHALAALSAQDFIERVLVEGLGTRYLVVGDDFRFGKRREGNFGMLQEAGARHGFEVAHTPSHVVAGERVSSTRIRAALAAGDMESAAELLGRPYSLCGRVIHGDKRGRSIDFPTANIDLRRSLLPVTGVFAVEVCGIGSEPVVGVANIGSRPTVCGVHRLLEVFLFDFDRDIYGQLLEVHLLHKLREEMRFESFDMLKQQIRRDVETARAFFAGNDRSCK